MAINKESISSLFNDKVTLLEWLKKVEKALNEGTIANCELIKVSRATFKFYLKFADDTSIESNPITIDSDNIVSASLVGGHLVFLTEEGRQIDAGHLSGNLGNVICDVLDVHGDIHAEDVYASGNVNVTGDVNSSNIGAMTIDIGNLQSNMTAVKDKLAHVEQTQYGLTIGTPVTINNNLLVNGDIDLSENGGVYAFEKIKDKHGNLRFVEGDIDTSSFTGANITYSKWSLSGSHLMFVIAGTCDEALGDTQSLGVAVIPSWIINKIFAFNGTHIGTALRAKLSWYDTNGNYDSGHDTILHVNSNVNMLQILNRSPFTPTTYNHFRIQFDLLIDND